MKKNLGVLFGGLLCAGFLAAASTSYAAVDKVRCVPWQGDPGKYHTAISGQSARLTAVVTTTNTSTVWYRWVFGDGSQTAVSTLSGSQLYKLSIDHTYTGSSGTPSTAQLLVDAVDSSMANAVADNYLVKIEDNTLDARVNIAIDNGLWWLYTNNYSDSNFHTFDNSPIMAWRQWSYGSFFASPTASAVQAFAINSHKVTGDVNQDPYVEAVQNGMNWLVKGYYANTSYPMLQALAVSMQHGVDNPDGNSNGWGIQVRDYSSYPIYEGGQIMDAIIASGVVPSGNTGRDFTGRGSNWTYGELLQDMADMYSAGQCDSSSGGIIGGWRYSWGDWPDNSASQWAAIGMIPAQAAPWNVVVPQWVKTYNSNWLAYSYNAGHFGYESANYQHDWYFNTTPSGMVQMSFVGQVGFNDPATPADDRDPKWKAAEAYLADNWSGILHNSSYNWGGQLTYSWYAFAKAMRLAVPQPVERITRTNGTTIDWYKGSGTDKGLAQRIVESQVTGVGGGYWNGSLTNTPLTTAWMIIILRPALFQAAPVACFNADPNPAYPDAVIAMDPSCSGHSETGKDISNLTKFEWDWNNDGVYDASTTDPNQVTHQFACAVLPCTYPVSLRVTDDNNPALTATVTRNINITNPPHPPSADADGPYVTSFCPSDSLKLDGSGSFDPNEGIHEAGCSTCPNDTITAWDWDLVPPLTGFGDASGETVTLNAAAIATSFAAPGSHQIGLRVTDNTAAAFPGSQDPNLTDADFSTVTVYDDCICTLTARPKVLTATSAKVQLVWTHTGAASYDIYRSTTGPNSGFTLIADDVVTSYATYLDTNVQVGTTYWYRVVSGQCGSQAASAKPVVPRR